MPRDEPLVFNFDVDTARLMRAMYTEDDVGAIIRLHFELDRVFDHIVKAMVPAPKKLNLQYASEKANLLLALGLPEVLIGPFLIINRIRNNFAHKEKEEIVLSDAVELRKAVEAMYGREIPEHFKVIHRKKDGGSHTWHFGDMTPKEKFCFLGSLTIGGIATIENDFERVAFRRK